jgi:hypothetical protein
MGEDMSSHQWASPQQLAVTPMELVRLTEEKAQRFAESPPAGYLAGYAPRQHPVVDAEDGRLAHISRWNDELSWLYAVAEQDIPQSFYRWGIVELPEGHFKLVLAPVEPADE